MKYLLVVIFVVSSVCSFAKGVSLTILADNQPIAGVGIYINGNIKTITNEQGKAQLTNLNNGDTIRTSYLGYKPEIIFFSSQEKDLTINLISENFELNSVIVSAKNDRSLFKKKLKWGLQESMVHKSIPFHITDTLYFFQETDTVYYRRSGNFGYPIRGREISIKKNQEEFFFSTSGTNQDEQINHAKRSKSNIEICFGFLYGLVNFNKDVKMIYMDDNSEGFEQFYFYIPDNNWIHAGSSRNKSYCGGIVYLDSEGVIARIKVHKTPFDSSTVSFEYDIDYVYDRKRNEVIPYRASIQSHVLNKEMKVVRTTKSCLEIYSEQAISAKVISIQ